MSEGLPRPIVGRALRHPYRSTSSQVYVDGRLVFACLRRNDLYMWRVSRKGVCVIIVFYFLAKERSEEAGRGLSGACWKGQFCFSGQAMARVFNSPFWTRVSFTCQQWNASLNDLSTIARFRSFNCVSPLSQPSLLCHPQQPVSPLSWFIMVGQTHARKSTVCVSPLQC